MRLVTTDRAMTQAPLGLRWISAAPIAASESGLAISARRWLPRRKNLPVFFIVVAALLVLVNLLLHLLSHTFGDKYWSRYPPRLFHRYAGAGLHF